MFFDLHYRCPATAANDVIFPVWAVTGHFNIGNGLKLGGFARFCLRFWDSAPHVCASLQPRIHGILHFPYRIKRRVTRRTATRQIRRNAKIGLIFVTPKYFNQISWHIYSPCRATVSPDTAGYIHRDSENLATEAHLTGHKSEFNSGKPKKILFAQCRENRTVNAPGTKPLTQVHTAR